MILIYFDVISSGVLSPHPLVARGLLTVTTCVPKTDS